MDPSLIKACLVDGETTKEFEITDENECIERDLLTRIYQDADGNPIPGYAPVTQILNAVLLTPDSCCM